MPEGPSLALHGLLFYIYKLTVPTDWKNNRDVIPSTAAVPGRDSSLCRLTEKMVKTLSCWPGAVTLLFNMCFNVVAVQQAQPSSGEPPEGSSQQGWEEQGAFPAPEGLDRLHSLAEAERLLDELTQEKMQVGSVQWDPPTHLTTSGAAVNRAHRLFCPGCPFQ